MKIGLNKQLLLKALTIPERISYYKSLQNFQDLSLSIDPQKAGKNLGKWKAQYPYSKGNRFDEKLKKLGITENQFALLIDDPMLWSSKDPDTYPGWITKLETIYDEFAPSAPFLSERFKPIIPLAVLFDCLEPLIANGRKRLMEKIRENIKLEEAPLDIANIEDLLTFHIGFVLFDVISRTMVLEINVARVQNQLKGETSDERFNNFIMELRQPWKLKSLIEEYPVMFRQAMDFMDRWVDVSFELVQRLYSDWKELQETFGIRQMSPLSKIQHGAGDKHNGGRTVTIITFGSGEKVVYKPRSMQIDTHFQQLVEWFNKKGLTPPLKTLKMVVKDEYGWAEFVEHEPCKSKEEITRYYERLGHLLGILYLINATDFHADNIIASGEYPMLVDLESLFNYSRVFKMGDLDAIVSNAMERSVLKISLLPFRFYIDKNVKAIDLGGATNLEGKMNPSPVPLWSAEGTDEMKLTRTFVPMQARKNFPKYTEGEIKLLDYAQVIEKSFRNCYDFILKKRDELLSKDSIFESFSKDRIRVLLRPTLVYAKLIGTCFHPDLLRNQADRDLIYEKLHEAVGEQAITDEMIEVEKLSLIRMDVPIYFSEPESRDLILDNGECISNFFATSGMEDVGAKINKFSEEDLEKQCWFIRASMACSVDTDGARVKESYPFEIPGIKAGPAEIMDAARSIADRLETLAFHQNESTDWAGIFLKDDVHHEIRPLAVDLYSGIAGVVLFLGYIGKITGEPRYLKLYETALKTFTTYIDHYLKIKFTKFLGAFEGWGGIIHTFTHLGVLFDKPVFFETSEKIIDLVEEAVDEVKGFDIVTGHAGLLLNLLNFNKIKPYPKSVQLAIRLGDSLEKNALAMESGKGWLIHSEKPLAGFAHGAAGIAFALNELYSVTGEKRFYDLAMDALAYERSVFLPQKGNWADLRDFNIEEGNIDSEKINMVAWCTGAAGVGIGRLGLLKRMNMNDPRVTEELNIAVQTTLKEGFGLNHSLCHGDLGNLDFLLTAGLHLKNESLVETVYKYTTSILSSLKKYGAVTGTLMRVENPGLMTGLSGIGYELLRLARPEAVPSVLLMEPPSMIN